MRSLLSALAVLCFAGVATAQHRCGGYTAPAYSTQTHAAPTYAAPTYTPNLVIPAAIFVVPGSPTVQLNLTTYSAGYAPVYPSGYAPAVTVFQVLPPVQPTPAPPPAAPAVPPAK